MLAGILVLYAIVIGFGDTSVGATIRVALIGFLVWNAARLFGRQQRNALVAATLAVLATATVAAFGGVRAASALVGALSALLIGMAIAAIAATLYRRSSVDISTVLGALCIYLLFALFFAGLHQFFGAFFTPYLNGTGSPPSAADVLYFSVITLTTVGFGDITPASEVARSVTVTEALVGQLYLVSVVAGVVGGWRGRTEA
jgi:hypothetical protein